MTPSEKAIELVDWFMPHMPPTTSKLSHAKQCAVKVCEEVLKSGPPLFYTNFKSDWNQVIEQIKAIKTD